MKDDETLKNEYPLLYRVAREHGTERPFSSSLLQYAGKGDFHCAVCGAKLFRGDTKFDSGSGWPSFTDPVNQEAVTLYPDTSHGMRRTEVRCANCDAHLGHVFPDGPLKGGEDGRERHDRYCINGISLEVKND